MWMICTLGSAAAFMLGHGEGIPKTPLIWVHTLMALLLPFRLNVPGTQHKLDSHHSKITSKLQSLQVHPDTLHYSKFEQANSVCCTFQVDFEFSHVKARYRQALVSFVCRQRWRKCVKAAPQQDVSLQTQEKD